MRKLLHDRPWLLIVALLGVLVLANLVMVWISVLHPIVPIAKS